MLRDDIKGTTDVDWKESRHLGRHLFCSVRSVTQSCLALWQKIVCHSFHCSPSICHKVMGPDAMIFIFLMLRFKPAFSLFSFIKTFFSSSLLSAIRVVSSACLKLLIFPLEILIPACASSNPACHIMYSAYKLNKHGDNYSLDILLSQFCCSQSAVPCSVLTVASWPAYRLLGAGKLTWSSHLFKNFPQFVVIHTVKDFGIVNKTDVFLELLVFLMIQRMLAVLFLVPLPFLNQAWTSWSSWFMYS